MLFIAMRYVPDGNARTLLRRGGPLPPERAIAIVVSVAAALDAAHAAGLVHRDVKPSNVLMDIRPGHPDHVYLSDFGLTKGMLSSGSITGTGDFLGTVDYAAPEQIEGRDVDARTDEYALACSAYELLSGTPPFPRDQPLAVLHAHLATAAAAPVGPSPRPAAPGGRRAGPRPGQARPVPVRDLRGVRRRTGHSARVPPARPRPLRQPASGPVSEPAAGRPGWRHGPAR